MFLLRSTVEMSNEKNCKTDIKCSY